MTAPTDSPATPPVRCQAADSCDGVQVGGSGVCLAHLNPSELTDWLATLEPGSDLDLRATQVESGRLARLLIALRDEEGCPRLGTAGFDGARFSTDVSFERAQFSGNAWFRGAQFSGDVTFRGAQFQGEDVWFDGAQFEGERVWFDGAQFSAHASFKGAQFSAHARFDEAQFRGDAWFDEAQFRGDVLFRGAQFSGSAGFTAGFEGAQFARPVTLGPLLVRGTLSLAAASFADTLVVKAAAARLRLDRATCAADVSLQLRYTEVILDGSRLAQQMTIEAANPFTWPTYRRRKLVSLDETAFAQPGQSFTPRLLSVRSTDVATLVVADLSLAPCRFTGAHHLDQLRLEGTIKFAQPPRGLRVGRAWPPVWWWTRRQTLAEEHAWRATRPKGAGWHDPETEAQPPAWLEEATEQPPQRVRPERLTGLYRALRQAQEDRKNEPGAADFYYGEMEMRRLATSTPWAERVILFAYWLVAGYGLRGLRALAALGVVVVGLAGLFHSVGFAPARPAPSWWDSLLYTAGSTLSISDDAVKLTALGKLLRILLRLLGPLLLGLALLSIRGRVKR